LPRLISLNCPATQAYDRPRKAKRAMLSVEAPPVAEGSRLDYTTRLLWVTHPYDRGELAGAVQPPSYRRDKAKRHCRCWPSAPLLRWVRPRVQPSTLTC